MISLSLSLALVAAVRPSEGRGNPQVGPTKDISVPSDQVRVYSGHLVLDDIEYTDSLGSPKTQDFRELSKNLQDLVRAASSNHSHRHSLHRAASSVTSVALSKTFIIELYISSNISLCRSFPQ